MRAKVLTALAVLVGFIAGFLLSQPYNVIANEYIRVYVDGKEVISKDAPAQIINDRTMLPVRAVAEALGLEVVWDEVNRTVNLKSPKVAAPSTPKNNNLTNTTGSIDYNIPIMGESVATSEQLRAVLKRNNPNAPDLVDLYLRIGKEYGVRGDLAFCQAAKETGWWRYGGLVKPEQNNYCGLGATGRPATGEESLNGANPERVWYVAGEHGAYFKTPADGVEAHIQHLYAYATKAPLPKGKEIVDPRFTLVTRGIAPKWIDLNGRWAVPGTNYGQSIIADYFGQAVPLTAITNNTANTSNTYADELEILRKENELLKMEIKQLRSELGR